MEQVQWPCHFTAWSSAVLAAAPKRRRSKASRVDAELLTPSATGPPRGQPVDPADDFTEPILHGLFQNVEAIVVNLEGRFDSIKALIDLDEMFVDQVETLVDLVETLVHFAEGLSDLLELRRDRDFKPGETLVYLVSLRHHFFVGHRSIVLRTEILRTASQR
jgi:hypothetical protein